MNREYHRWYSPSLGHDMEMLAFGHAGLPVVVFPTSFGRFFEWEDFGMIRTLSDKIDAGYVQLYCIDSVDRETWYNRSVHPRQRVARARDYERYILNEVVPLIEGRMRDRADKRIALTGASLGGFHAAILAFRHPHAVQRLISLSGKFDSASFLDGYSDTETYLFNPMAFIPQIDDSRILDAMRAMDIVIVSGAADPHIQEDRYLSHVLWEKGISNTLDIWDGWSHDWPYWFAMIRKYL